MSIVTKTGDAGETGLLGGQRVPKTDPRMEAIGTVDELSAHLGLVGGPEIERLQCDLFELGALLANPTGQGDFSSSLQRIEEELAAVEAMLPPLKNFILPGGTPEAAQLHLARTVCRRAERAVCTLSPLPSQLLPYLNRLSDYLFLLARKANQEQGQKEVIWKKV